MTDRWFEDYPVGLVTEHGAVEVTTEEILEFGRRYDPQAFHVDEAAAVDGPYGGLISSGWQTCAWMMRLFVEACLSDASSLGGLGIDELRWLRPVRPGDVLSLRAEVIEARPSNSQPDRGLVKSRCELFTADGHKVLSLVVLGLVRRRPDGTS